MLPAACVLDGRAPPETRRPIEIKKPSATAAGGLFEQEVPVEEHRLNASQERISSIQMTPPGLDHPDLVIRKVMDRFPQHVRRRHKVGVEDEDEFARARVQSMGQRSGLKPGSIGAMDQFDIQAGGFE